MKRYFNTSGPNMPKEHYTLQREEVINTGLDLVERSRYFTIWAPRQTGKSTYFRLLAEKLKTKGYKPVFFSTEGFDDYSIADIFDTFCRELQKQQNISWHIETFKDFEKKISTFLTEKLVIIIDEIEGLNKQIFGQFLHTIRNLYHTRMDHCLKSVVLVGVSNITGIVEDNASPFNIADNLLLDYFTRKEVHELLSQHETETGQLFLPEVKDKIYQITAGQPGLVNGFAQKLISEYPDKQELDYDDYLKVEDWYLRIPIDRNFSNILNKAKKYRLFAERLLFAESKIPFRIDRESIKVLHSNGLIKDDGEGSITFWVPFYKKRLYDAFYPYTNGESDRIKLSYIADDFLNDQNRLDISKLITGYKGYVKKRGFKVFMTKQEDGSYNTLRESGLIYSFETFITVIVEELEGKIYREPDTGLGKSDMIINIGGQECVIETKVYSSPSLFMKGKTQLAYYCKSVGLQSGFYLVFKNTEARSSERVKEGIELIDGVEIRTFLVDYDTEKW